MKIRREQVLNIYKYLDDNLDFYFPFKIICNDFNEGNEYFNINCLDIKYKELENNTSLVNFILEENLKHSYQDTTELLAKGFLDKIENIDILNKISILAVDYRKNWKEELWESEDSEEFGINEFIGGKAEAYEDCLQMIKEHLLTNQLLSLDVIIKELESLAQIFETDSGDSINYIDIYKWKERATKLSINKISNYIIEMINGQFDYNDQKIYVVAESVIKEIKSTIN